jgi:glyoxylase-like metal-dependent hydrolase (beta-lactamase superfamily II)
MEHRRREPAPGIFRLTLPLPFPGLDHVNAYLLQDEDGMTLVDCGIFDPARDDGGWSELVSALGAADASVDDVSRLVVTHPHVDHYGMAARFVEVTGAELCMHEAAGSDLEIYRDPETKKGRLRTMLEDHGFEESEIDELSLFEDWRVYLSGIVDATGSLKDGDSFAAGDRTWIAVHTPGHARSHVCLWNESDGILISGDHLLPSITPHIDFRRGEDQDPLGQFLRSLERIESLAPELVLPGHGRPFEDGAERARITIRHHDRRLGSILQVIRREPHSADEITNAIFGDTLLNFQKRLALGEALAHLAYLRRRGEIERKRLDDDRLVYAKVAGGGGGGTNRSAREKGRERGS